MLWATHDSDCCLVQCGTLQEERAYMEAREFVRMCFVRSWCLRYCASSPNAYDDERHIDDDVTSPCVVDVVQVLGCGSEDSSNPPQTHATRSTIDFQLRRFFAFSHHEWFVAHFRILWSEIDLLLSMYCEHGVRAYSSSVYTCIHVSRLNCWHLAPVLL